MDGETSYWLLSLPLEGRISRSKDGIDQVVQVVRDKSSDIATTHKARSACALRCAPRRCG